MILDAKQTTVAYRCPHCGSGVLGMVGMFSLSADMLKLKCACGESEMTILYTKDKKIRMTVPCILCPTPHNFTVNSSVFFKNELFVLPCPYSDVNVAMIGEENQVKAELSRTELELLELLEESGQVNFDALHGEQTLTDPQIFDVIMFVIRELDAEGKIYCKCKTDEEGDYEAEVLDDAIRVSCKRCGASQIIPTDSFLGAHAFLNADSLHLE